MELTPKQKELLERAQSRATGQLADGASGGLAASRGENPAPAPAHVALGGGMTPRQRELLELGAGRAGVTAESEDEGMGFWEGARNSVARGLSNLRNIPDVAVAEELPARADFERDRAARAESGDLPLWEQVLTFQMNREDPDALDQQAAEAATRAAQRQRATQERFPMSPRGEQAVRNLMDVGSFRGGLDVVLDDPLGTISGAAQVAAEQLPTIAAAGVMRRPLGVPTMGLSTFAQERYGQLIQEAADAGYDLTDPEQAKAAVEDDAFMARQAERGRTRGTIIGAVDLITAGIASKTPTTLRGVAGNTGVQTGAGAGGEAAAEFADTGTINPGEVILEGLAEGVTAPADVAALGVRGRGGLSDTGTDLNSQLAAEEAAEDAILAQEAQDQAQEREAAAVDQQQELRDRFAPTFMPPKEFEKQRNAQREADVLNPETEIGREFQTWRREQGIYHPDEYAKAAKEFLKVATPENDADLARQEYLDSLDAHADNMMRVDEALTLTPAMQTNRPPAQEAPQEPAKPKKPTKKEQARIDAEERLGPDWEVNNPDLSSMVEDGKSIYIKKKGAQPKFWQRLDEIEAEMNAPEQGVAETQQAVQTTEWATSSEDSAAAPVNTPSAVEALDQTEEQADPAARRQEVISRANQDLGPDWMSENKDLVEQLGRGDFDAVEREIAKRAAERTPDTEAETPNADAQVPVANTAEEQAPATEQAPAETEVAPATEQAPAETEVAPAETEVAPAETEVAPAETEVAPAAAPFRDPKFEGSLSTQQKRVYAALSTAAEKGTLGELVSLQWEAGTDTDVAADPEAALAKDRDQLRAEARAKEAARKKVLKDAGVTDADLMEKLFGAKSLRQLSQKTKAMEAAGVPADVVARFKAAKGEVSTKPKERGWRIDTNNAAIAAASGIEKPGSAKVAAANVAMKLRQFYGIDRLREMLAQSGVTEGGGIAQLTTEESAQAVNEAAATGGVATVSSAGAGQGAKADGSRDASGKRVLAEQATKAEETRLMKKAGMSDAKIKEFYRRAQEVEGLNPSPEEKAAEAEATLATELDALAAMRPMLAREWQNFSNREDVNFDALPESDQLQWVNTVVEMNNSNDLGKYDKVDRIQRDIERNFFDAQNDIPNESRAVEDEADSQGEADTSSTEGPSSRRPDTPTDSVAGGTDATRGQETDTGVVGTQRTAPVVETKKRKKLNKEAFAAKGKKPDAFSLSAGKAKNPSSVIRLGSAAEFHARQGRRSNPGGSGPTGSRPGGPYSRLKFHQTAKEASKAVKGAFSPEQLGVVQGFVDPNDRNIAHFIADNIERRTELAVLEHEAGVHLGMEAEFDKAQMGAMASAVRQWKDSPEGSVERAVSDAVAARLAFARSTGMDPRVTDVETVAYAAEEAVKQGVVPSFDAKDQVARWLADVKAFFEKLLSKLTAGGTSPALTAEQLVAFTRSFAQGVTADIIVETGALTTDSRQVAGYYSAEERGNEVEADAKVIDADETPGMEPFFWGKNSELGGFNGVTTEAELFQNGDGDVVIVMNVFGRDNSKPRDPLALTTFDMTNISPNHWTVTIYGPEDSVLELYPERAGTELDVDGNEWNTLKGVTARQNMRLMTEARRRITRFQGGRAPHISATRVTGAAAKNKQGSGRIVSYDEETLINRFSLSPQEGAASQRQWAENNFGGETTTQFLDTTKAIWKGGTNSVKPMSRFIRDVAKTMPSAQRWWDGLLAAKQTKREITGIVDELSNRARQLAPERKARLNKFIGDSTFFQQWGYDPKIEGKKVKINPIMAKRFAKLTAEEQQIVRDVFDHGENIRNRMNQIAKELGIDKMFTIHSKLDGPYAPLKRFGSNVVTLRSQAVIDAEAKLRENNTKLNRDKVEKLKGDPEHYVVKFFDTMGAAKKFANAQRGKYAEAVAVPKSPDTEAGLDTNSRTYQKILAALNAGKGADIPTQSKDAVAALIKDLYFQSLEETNARLAGARRLNRSGYDADMMRAFTSHGRAQAQLIAQMKHGGEINEALATAQDEIKRAPAAERERLQNTFNVIAQKNADLLKPRNGLLDKVQDHVLSFNTAYMLTTSLGYHVTNKLQPIYSVAKVGADFNAYGSAWRHLFSGEKIARRVVDTSFMRQVGTVVTSGLVDMNNKLEIKVENAPAKYQPLLRELQLRDLLDVGIEEDLNLDNRFDFGFNMLNKASSWYHNTTHRLYQTARFVEAHNRIASAISAFEVASNHKAALARMDMTAKDYAIGLIQDTQGDFSAEETPLIMSALPRTATQFRKYQIMMAWLHADALKRSFSKSTPRHERVAAVRTMIYLFGTTAFMSGAVGIPAANLGLTAFQMASQAMAAAFGWEDEPEPEDLERMVRDHFSEDPQMATLISRGVPAFLGLDMSTKMSLNDVFQPWDTRFVSPEASYEGFATFAGQMILGPTAGVGGSLFTGAGYLAEGDIYRGVERIVPKGARSIMESFRFSEEGYKTPSGTVLADPREFSMFDFMSNATGLPSADINTMKWRRGQQWELERWFNDENTRLRQKFVEAHQDKDTAAMKAIREEHRELQKAKARVRPFFNNAPGVLRHQSTATLNRAVQDYRNRQRESRRKMGPLKAE